MNEYYKVTDCGRTIVHAPHTYYTPRKKLKACDGVLKERKRTHKSKEM